MRRLGSRVLTVPNIITAIRIGFLPAVVLFFLRGDAIGYLWAYLFAILGEVTDVTDGYIARARGETSKLGKLFDPLADSLTRFVVFLTFFKVGLIPLWMVIVFYLRDITVAYFRASVAAEGVVMGARSSGKIKAMFQSAATLISLVALAIAQTVQEGSHETAVLTVLGVGVGAFGVYAAVFRIRGWLLWVLIGLLVPSAGPLVALLTLNIPAFDPHPLVYWLVFAAALYTLYSLVDYSRGFAQSMGWIKAPGTREDRRYFKRLVKRLTTRERTRL